PSGQRDAARYSRQAASSGKRRWNSTMLRGKSGLGTQPSYAPHLTEPDKHYTTNNADVGADSGVEALEAGGADVAVLPGVHRAQPRAAELRLLEREAERRLRPLRVVDADDDRVHGR